MDILSSLVLDLALLAGGELVCVLPGSFRREETPRAELPLLVREGMTPEEGVVSGFCGLCLSVVVAVFTWALDSRGCMTFWVKSS